MFDLRFISVVEKVLKWTEPAPATRFANTHESFLQQKLKPTRFQDVANAMSANEMILHIYVRDTYPAYFGLDDCRTGQCFKKNYHSTFPEY